jgi:hypothetical protein
MGPIVRAGTLPLLLLLQAGGAARAGASASEATAASVEYLP